MEDQYLHPELESMELDIKPVLVRQLEAVLCIAEISARVFLSCEGMKFLL